MIEEIRFTLQLIRIEIFIAFGLFTILYFLLSIFINNSTIKKVDEESNRFISFIGVVYLILWLMGICVELFKGNEEERSILISKMF
jgi:succinate-acetate transporter protein